MNRRASWLAWAALGIVAALGGAWLARTLDAPARVQLASGTWLDEPRPIGDFSLVDADGRAFGPERLAGGPTVLFFGFANCPHVCPATLAQLAQAKRAAPELRVILISVDPQRDTPAVLRSYVRGFHPDFEALTGDIEAIERLERDLAVASRRVELPGGGYTIDHSATIYLLDAQGRWVAVFTPPIATEALTADLRRASEQLAS